jgi:hypothetical protein
MRAMKPPGPEAQLVRFILDLDEFCFLMAVTGSEAKNKAKGSRVYPLPFWN